MDFGKPFFCPEIQSQRIIADKLSCIALKATVDKLDINELVNVLTGLNNVKTKINYLDVGELKTVTTNFKRLRDAVSKEVVKKTMYNKLNTKVNNLEKRFLMYLL